MHKLDRATVPPPTCLGNYQHPRHTWGNLTQDDKDTIVDALCQMQGNAQLQEESDQSYLAVHCAYCEDVLHNRSYKHVEHFRRKNKDYFPQLTFAWDNLFLSCQTADHCGHYKDRKNGDPYNPDDLIKPDDDDPDDFLYFHSTGEVRSRRGISAEAKQKAEETIRVFNLNDRKLRGQRYNVVNNLVQRTLGDNTTPDDLLDLLNTISSDARRAFIQETLEAEQWFSFPTTLRHFFTRI